MIELLTVNEHDCHDHETCLYMTESMEMGEICYMKCKVCGRRWEEELCISYGCHEVVFHYRWATGGLPVRTVDMQGYPLKG